MTHSSHLIAISFIHSFRSLEDKCESLISVSQNKEQQLNQQITSLTQNKATLEQRLVVLQQSSNQTINEWKTYSEGLQDECSKLNRDIQNLVNIKNNLAAGKETSEKTVQVYDKINRYVVNISIWIYVDVI